MKNKYIVIAATLALAAIGFNVYLDHEQQVRHVSQPCHVVWYQGQAHPGNGCPQ